MIVGHVMLDETNFEMKRILFGRLSHTFEFHTGHQPRENIKEVQNRKNEKVPGIEHLKPSPK